MIYRKILSVIGGLFAAWLGGMTWYYIVGKEIFGIKVEVLPNYYHLKWSSNGVATFSTIAAVLISFLGGYLITYLVIFPILQKIKSSISNTVSYSKNIIDSKLNLTTYPVKYYSIAEDEINNNSVDKNIWALALVKAKGDEKLRKAEYIKLRVKQLSGK